MIDNYRAFKAFLDNLVRDRYLKEFIDEEKTQTKKTEVRINQSLTEVTMRQNELRTRKRIFPWALFT